MGQHYKSYNKSLKLLDLKTLKERRLDICLQFAKKSAKSKKYQAWFRKAGQNTRFKTPFTLPYARTARYEKSPLIYLTKLLNEDEVTT